MTPVYLRNLLLGTALATAFTASAAARAFDIPGGSLETALDAYAAQTGTPLIVSNDAIKGIHSKGVKGDLAPGEALLRLLNGTGFTVRHDPSGGIGIVPEERSSAGDILPLQLAQAAPPRSSMETVTVTSSKLGGADVQSIPIAITALSQEQLTSTQTAGGPDLVKQVPNLTFTKTNFTGYNISIRGIGTAAISATTDPAVAVSFNDIPFLRNHFFEQEFFDVSQVEVLRGPQGTLYGRNATSGVVNVISALPSDQWEARASVDVGNYNNRRMEGMLNLPLIGDKLDLRVAGEWTKRDGYSMNGLTGRPIDGRNLWSGRVSLRIQPIERLSATFVFEHFDEDDDRERSTKQLCTRDQAPAVVNGPTGPQAVSSANPNLDSIVSEVSQAWYEQGCRPASLYSPTMFQTPNGAALPAVDALWAGFIHYAAVRANPYGEDTQSPDLRVIDALLDPQYRAKNNTIEFNVQYDVTPELSVTSQTGYNDDYLYSTEDFNRYDTAPDYFQDQTVVSPFGPLFGTIVGSDHEYCDPQLGCTSRLVSQDISRERARQFYQELRMSSKFSGPFNFLAGANYLSYDTHEDYFVLSNALSLATEGFNLFPLIGGGPSAPATAPHIDFDPTLANSCNPQPQSPTGVTAGILGLGCAYVDPNPLSEIDGDGHNYFRSQNPFKLRSWAIFGEAYYDIAPDVKLTGGLRFTDDKKDFDVYPSWTLVVGKGYPFAGTIKQEWQEVTGRAVVNWTPKLDFTDQTLVYASYAHGYKGGGANPPGMVPVYSSGLFAGSPDSLTHPVTFKPEFNNAFELGTKNKLFDGAISLNGDVFLYKYQNYQISQIVDRTAINFNYNATVKGAELETTWEPLPGLKLGFNGGYEDARFDDNQYAIDLMDRTAGDPNYMVVKPYITQTSNCILPTSVVNRMLANDISPALACFAAYSRGSDPASNFEGDISVFDPATVPNHGEGIAKNIGGNEMPNAPHFTTSLSADYSMPLSEDWAGTLHGDFYWQSNSYWRIFNDLDYDKLRGYTNINLALIFTNQDGWQAMVYAKNVLDTTAITGAFLNSDDTALTTNVFVTDPRLFGIRITKNW